VTGTPLLNWENRLLFALGPLLGLGWRRFSSPPEPALVQVVVVQFALDLEVAVGLDVRRELVVEVGKGRSAWKSRCGLGRGREERWLRMLLR
jgi:hypothetical protein